MQTNEDFNIPFYLVQELVSYVEERAKGKNRISQWDNLCSLIALAEVNERITQEQATFLIEEFNREKNL